MYFFFGLYKLKHEQNKSCEGRLQACFCCHRKLTIGSHDFYQPRAGSRPPLAQVGTQDSQAPKHLQKHIDLFVHEKQTHI